MKLQLLTLLVFVGLKSYAQETYVPDDNFEAYLEANAMGNGIPDDDYVSTSNIMDVIYLNVNNQNISDLTGIQAFVSLNYLDCGGGLNQLTSLDVSQNIELEYLMCESNNLTSIDVSQNTILKWLWLGNNQLTTLDLSNNDSLTSVRCFMNELVCLNLKNGNNSLIYSMYADSNPNLTCIEVDDVDYANNNWFYIDAQTSFSTDCNNECSNTAGIAEISKNDKELLKVVDLMGRETIYKPNTALIYIYSDGTSERVFILN